MGLRATLNDRRGILALSTEIDLNTYTQETVGVVATDTNSPITTNTVAGIDIEPKGSGFRYRAPNGTAGIKTLTLREKPNSGGPFKSEPASRRHEIVRNRRAFE